MGELVVEPAALIDGNPADSLPLNDRGLLYGDGLFETTAFRDGRCALWPWHMERLERGAERLRIELPSRALLLDECRTLAAQNDCVLRLTVTRGSSLRPGYAPSGLEQPRRLLVRLPMPAPRGGLRVGICEERLPSPGPAAGLKHLSRLDQVLLAQEVAECCWDEGLVFDPQGQLCEGLQSNVLVLPDEHAQWLTPTVGAGVEGACRAALLSHGLARVAKLGLSDLEHCAALALCNAVRGVEPITELVGINTLTGEAARLLSERLTSALERQETRGALASS
ncbi:MAG: aminotransferase class IV [Pseudomonadota bacterium]